LRIVGEENYLASGLSADYWTLAVFAICLPFTVVHLKIALITRYFSLGVFFMSGREKEKGRRGEEAVSQALEVFF
jgi:uncharacterized protein HemY